MKRLIHTLRRVLRLVIEAAQKVVMEVSLFFVYFLGIGLTWVLAIVAQRWMLRGTPAGQGSYWIAAEGYDSDPEQAARQS